MTVHNLHLRPRLLYSTPFPPRFAPSPALDFHAYLGVEAQFVELHGDAFRAVVELADHVLVLLRQGVADGPVREGLPAVAPIHLVEGGVRGRKR